MLLPLVHFDRAAIVVIGVVDWQSCARGNHCQEAERSAIVRGSLRD